MSSQTRKVGQAVVIGGSIAGLLSARVLSEHFETVIVVDRDPFPASPETRKGVPQGNHIHALLEAGLRVLDDLFPGMSREMQDEGVERIDMARDAAWLQSGSWKTRFEGDVESILVSRPHLEWKVRGRVAGLPNVELRQGVSVEHPVLDASGQRVVGVKVKTAEGERVLDAALVVDASGRGSRAPQWLESLGFGAVPQEQVRIDLGYTSRLYERPEGFDDWKILVINGRAPETRRSGFISNVEGGRWIVSLNGYFGDHAPTDPQGFLEFARHLPTPHLYEYIRQARPLSAPVLHKVASSRWLRYERMARMPEGFVLLGDSVCSLNPVFGQGMTVAALGARLLGECVARARGTPSEAGLTRRFQKQLGKIVGLCWLLTTTQDLAYPQAEGRRRPGIKLLQWSFNNMIDLTSMDVTACQRFYDVLHMRKGLEGLLDPGFAGALLTYNLKSLLVPRARRANLDTLPPHPSGRGRAGGKRGLDSAA